MRHLAQHDPNNAEYQEALRRDEASTGDEGEYEGGDDEGTTFLELHNAVAAGDGGVQLTELDSDQMQVCDQNLCMFNERNWIIVGSGHVVRILKCKIIVAIISIIMSFI